MKILLVGLSDIAKRRIFPALARCSFISSIDIASTKSESALNGLNILLGTFYNNYQQGIENTNADFIYISTVISSHRDLVIAALNAGKNVIVDKPISMSFAETRELIEKARSRSLLLAEATVYDFHPQIQRTKEIIDQRGGNIRSINASFCIPRLPADNFRNFPELGGGVLWDMGPYCVSPGRVFLSNPPLDIECKITERSPATGAELSAEIKMTYPGGVKFNGRYSFNGEYENSLSIEAGSITVVLNRVFSPPPDQSMSLSIFEAGFYSVTTVEPSDTFYNFLNTVLAHYQERNYEFFYSRSLKDAEVLDRVHRAKRDI